MKNLIIRKEEKSEHFEVENLIRESFWNVYCPGCSEHFLLHKLRDYSRFVDELDFVMEMNGKLIGQVCFTKIDLKRNDGKAIEVLTFGPISILREFQRKGFGKILLDFALEKAEKLGFGAVFIEGNYEFYKNCGFSFASEFNVHYNDIPREEKVEFFLCKELQNGFLKNSLENFEVTYFTPEIYRLNDDEVDLYDKKFPPKEKQKLPGQLFE